jgi:hypothetical protein
MTPRCRDPRWKAASRQLGDVLPGQRACHLDAGYDSSVTRQTLGGQGYAGQIAHKALPRRSRPGAAGPSSGPIHGRTATASSAG